MEKKITAEHIRAVLTVKDKTYLSPHYIRITLTGDEVALFEGATVGANNKIFLPAAGEREIHFDSSKSIRRTYTHRGIDIHKKEMLIDFVAHGENSPASAWAINAMPGARLGVAMKVSSAPLYPEADWYLLVADATGIPVVATILESLPARAKGVACIEVLNEAEEIPLTTPADIQVQWIHNATPGEKSPLIPAVRNIAFPDAGNIRYFGYVAAEFSTVKGVRIFLRNEQAWKPENLYAYSYWKYGKSEENSVKDRQNEKRSNS